MYEGPIRRLLLGEGRRREEPEPIPPEPEDKFTVRTYPSVTSMSFFGHLEGEEYHFLVFYTATSEKIPVSLKAENESLFDSLALRRIKDIRTTSDNVTLYFEPPVSVTLYNGEMRSEYFPPRKQWYLSDYLVERMEVKG